MTERAKQSGYNGYEYYGIPDSVFERQHDRAAFYRAITNLTLRQADLGETDGYLKKFFLRLGDLLTPRVNNWSAREVEIIKEQHEFFEKSFKFFLEACQKKEINSAFLAFKHIYDHLNYLVGGWENFGHEDFDISRSDTDAIIQTINSLLKIFKRFFGFNIGMSRKSSKEQYFDFKDFVRYYKSLHAEKRTEDLLSRLSGALNKGLVTTGFVSTVGLMGTAFYSKLSIGSDDTGGQNTERIKEMTTVYEPEQLKDYFSDPEQIKSNEIFEPDVLFDQVGSIFSNFSLSEKFFNYSSGERQIDHAEFTKWLYPQILASMKNYPVEWGLAQPGQPIRESEEFEGEASSFTNEVVKLADIIFYSLPNNQQFDEDRDEIFEKVVAKPGDGHPPQDIFVSELDRQRVFRFFLGRLQKSWVGERPQIYAAKSLDDEPESVRRIYDVVSSVLPGGLMVFTSGERDSHKQLEIIKEMAVQFDIDTSLVDWDKKKDVRRIANQIRAKGGKIANPGASSHESGLAADFVLAVDNVESVGGSATQFDQVPTYKFLGYVFKFLKKRLSYPYVVVFEPGNGVYGVIHVEESPQP